MRTGRDQMLRQLWNAGLLGVMGTALFVQAQQPPAREGRGGRDGAPQPNQTIQMIKPGFYVVSGDGGNTGVRVTKQGLIVVDTKNLGDPFYNALMAQIKTVSTLPVKYV